MKTFQYILKRILIALFVIFIIATFTFWLSRAIPGGPFSGGDKPLPPTVLANLERKYNLDKPIFEQYLLYMKDLCKLDFGLSMYNDSYTVNDYIQTRFPISCTLGVFALMLAVLLGIPMGIVSALRQNHWQDNIIKVLTTLFISMPSFVVASALMYYLGYKWGLLPIAKWGTWQQAVMPVLALSVGPLATITKYMKSSMLEVLNSDYVRTARAKGAGHFRVIYIHTLRNALLPILTIIGPMFAGIICGSFVVESIFAIPGLGKSFTEAIFNRDYTMIMGLTIFYSTLLIIVGLLIDIIYTFVDPRISLTKAKGES